MGLDLALIIIECPASPRWPANNRIELSRDYNLFSQITNIGRGNAEPVCSPRPLPHDAQFIPSMPYSIEYPHQDPYGAPLTGLSAGELSNVEVPADATQWNRAVFAMIRELPPETLIVLWWH